MAYRHRRVVVTGLGKFLFYCKKWLEQFFKAQNYFFSNLEAYFLSGVVCSLGQDVKAVWNKILDGKCGVSRIINPGIMGNDVFKNYKSYYDVNRQF